MTFWEWLWPSTRKQVREEELDAAVTAAIASRGRPDFSDVIHRERMDFHDDVKSPAVWAALERLELAGKIKRLPGRNTYHSPACWELYDWLNDEEGKGQG